VIQRDRPAFVALSEESFQDMLGELETARIAASLADLAAGRVRKGSATDLMAEILDE
jgi:PHD/YefM family antitoxin component YafN of YafNO toxin-antitoxin module